MNNTLRFSKMHGLGNDFMVIDLVSQHHALRAEQVRAWSDRHTGIGFDQLLALEPPTTPEADFRYRIFNADGSEAEHCGNGARCIGRFIVDQQLSPKSVFKLETSNALIDVSLQSPEQAEVGMGVPNLEPLGVPFNPELLTRLDEHRYRISTAAGDADVLPLSIGNPHAVIMVKDVQSAPVAELGPCIERHPAFPKRVNVGFCQVVDKKFARVRVFERGVGETRACGTGACAAAVAGQLLGLLSDQVKLSLTGGKLRISWPGPGTTVRMTGPATMVFEGQIEI